MITSMLNLIPTRSTRNTEDQLKKSLKKTLKNHLKCLSYQILGGKTSKKLTNRPTNNRDVVYNAKRDVSE